MLEDQENFLYFPPLPEMCHEIRSQTAFLDLIPPGREGTLGMV